MAEHPIQGLMTTAMENLKEMVDVNTIIGDPIQTPDGKTVILPVSKVGFGFAAGGSEFNAQSSSQSDSDDESDSESSSGGSNSGSLPFGGGSGGGVSITPIAFVIVNENGAQMVHLDQQTHLYERILDLAPQAVDKIQSLLKSQLGSSDGDKKQGDKNKQQNSNQKGEEDKQKKGDDDKQKEEEKKQGEEAKSKEDGGRNTPPDTL
ncbi:sporulation protein YtfJ [Virgibacillus sp. MSP4-1]|uniref:GerW family sporulation protein n=1 Tax=Virgibacillus sp. MSP4-1 TaxID=2700081 RepID=UPI0003A57EEB|nr:GerW family sporulation protein [Virgibacillus sp. MSP4-1]QHS23022.1 sporulation protein YtfJ [Virgibacillus sp. MSP4-1]